MKQRLTSAITVLLLAFLSGCGNARIQSLSDARIQSLMGGEAAYALIADLSKSRVCEAYRIDGYGISGPTAIGDAPGAKADKPRRLQGYPIISGPTAIDDASRAILSKVLTDPDTYLWDSAKPCEFVPGVALRLSDANVRVDVLVCFSCEELEMYTNGKRVGHEDFDSRRTDLLRVAKQLFPEDEGIQKLK